MNFSEVVLFFEEKDRVRYVVELNSEKQLQMKSGFFFLKRNNISAI